MTIVLNHTIVPAPTDGVSLLVARRLADQGAGDDGRLPRDLSGGALLREFHPPRLSSQLWADGHIAGGDRRNQSRVSGEEAYVMGLADVLVPQDQVRDAAIKLASEIGENSPLGLIATRMTMRNGIAEPRAQGYRPRPRRADPLRKADDFKEGVNAVSERRMPNFKGR